MKRLCKNISAISLLTFSLATSAFAESPVVRIDALSGKVFSHCNGEMKSLKVGDHLSDFCELFTEEGSQTSFSDFYDHRFHLSGSGHVKLFNKMAEVKSGYLWLQSPVNQGEYLIQTANAVISSQTGELIVSFDPAVGKTQLLNVKGRAEFSNALDRMMNVSLLEGHFSYIQNEHNDGYPRKPTPIGFASFKSVTSLFRGIEPLDGKAAPTVSEVPQRAVASVQVEKSPVMESEVSPEGKIIILRKDNHSERKEKAKELLKTYQDKISEMAQKTKPKKFVPSYEKSSGVPLRIYGMGKAYKKSVEKKASVVKPRSIASENIPQPKLENSSVRAPASVGGMAPQIKTNDAFEAGMTEQYKQQMRHSQEVNNLIDRLKSVDMDYQKNY